MKGIPINKLILRLPNKIHFTDASGKIIGRYNFQTGMTWNYIFPAEILAHMTINHLEFLVGLIELLLAKVFYTPIDHILLWIDNSTAILWLRK